MARASLGGRLAVAHAHSLARICGVQAEDIAFRGKLCALDESADAATRARVRVHALRRIAQESGEDTLRVIESSSVCSGSTHTGKPSADKCF